MRFTLSVLIVCGVGACQPTVSDAPRGVGFDDYDGYIAERHARDQQLSRNNPVVQSVSPPIANNQPPVITTPGQKTAQDAVAALGGGALNGRARNNPGISDEQDFEAVSNRQSIASDALRRAQQRSQYKVLAPTALPKRPSGGSPTPIEFALSTNHPVGKRKYARRALGSGKAAKACAKYNSSELAQDVFLKQGGPQKDKLGLDPDGDGYACNWNPARYRTLVKN